MDATSNSKIEFRETRAKSFEAKGHKLTMHNGFSDTFWRAGQAVMRDYATGVNYGASGPAEGWAKPFRN